MSVRRLALVPIGRVQFDLALGNELALAFRRELDARGYAVAGPAETVTDLSMAQAAARQLADQELDAILVLQTTFADSQMITQLSDTLAAPLFVWAPPDRRTGARLRLGTFTGINLACHALTRRGKPFGFAYAALDDAEAWSKLATFAAAGQVYRALRSTSLGVVGQRPDGMDTCDLDADELARRIGVQVRQVELGPTFERIQAVDPQRVAEVRRRLDQKLDNLAQLEQKPLALTLSTYIALKEMAQIQGMAGLAVRCWPEFFTQLGCAACGAISLLSDDGIPATCEADINGAVSHFILQQLCGGPAFSTDVVEIDTAKDEIVLWHCGQAPLSLADPTVQPHGTIHSNRRVPLMMDFALKPGPVTLARLSRSGGELRLVAGRGEMLQAPQAYSGTAGVFRFERPAAEFRDRILSMGLEHHISLAYGDYMPVLETLAELLRVPFVRI